MAYLQLVGGLIILVFAGDFLVRGAVSIAQKLGVPTLVIGLTIVAFGTSAPELVVGVDAVLAGAPTLALGNVVGSNIANVLLVVGIPALIAPICCGTKGLGRNCMIMIGANAIVIGLAQSGTISWPQGVILLALLLSFLFYSAVYGRKHPEENIDPLDELDGIDDEPHGYGVSVPMVLGGLIGLALGADLLVEGAVTIALSLGVSEAVIGLTLVAIGTSLPELVTAVAAAFRGHSDVAIGNVIGSNLFNILGILGVASLFGDIPIPKNFLAVDLWVMLATAVALVPYVRLRTQVNRGSGIVMVGLYGLYMYYLATSGMAATVASFSIGG